ncbi:MAG: bifunctional DNA-binding transcriptional regulator/O6-methylguanine-DNA methyltransferase Ada [Acidimicrobiales bacterium]
MSDELEPNTADEARWAAVEARDAAADGTFLYGVVTTGVFCRPSCPSRLPRQKNVRFFATAAEAERSGLRACKRCQPTGQGIAARRAELVASACRIIDGAEVQPDLAALAAEVGVSRFHLHRVFKEATGITPKAYADASRAGRVRRSLGEGGPVAEAIYDAGFSSNGRFYESSNERLGMTPTQFRDGAADVEVRFAVGQCSLGAILVAVSVRGVCAIELGDDPDGLVRQLQDRFHAAHLVGDDAEFAALMARAVALVEDPAGAGEPLPLDVRGTAFQERVWQALRQVPPGSTVSYAEVATAIGSPRSVRAVAGACAANHLAVAIPCHRVVRTDGELSGYRWGVERKAALLEREGATAGAARR